MQQDNYHTTGLIVLDMQQKSHFQLVFSYYLTVLKPIASLGITKTTYKANNGVG